MKKLLFLLFTSALFLLTGCSDDKDNSALDPKHEALPDFVENAKAEVKETYIMASNYPEALSAAPCYCGCYAQDGHMSVLDCFVDGMDSDKAVTGWDSMGVAWDICVVIAREATEMYNDGKERKEINRLIKEKYADYGEPTPTPIPE